MASNIIAKPFNAAQKIIRALFQGNPNLTTTSDLNRQIEALKYQLDLLDDRFGYYRSGGFDISATLGTDSEGSYIQVRIYQNGATPWVTIKGAQFVVPTLTQKYRLQSSSSNVTIYVVLTAPISTITYADDTTHEISGAKFQDGTSAAAADHLVYGTPSITISGAPSAVNAVGVLAKVHKDGNSIVVHKNYGSSTAEFNDPIIRGSVGDKQTIAPKEGQALANAMAYLSRSLVPIRTILPYYGSVECNSLPYGWVPCGAYFRNAPTEALQAEVNNWTSRYGSSISAIIDRSRDSHGLVRIERAFGIDIPDLNDRFLTGAGFIYERGNIGGENTHTLSPSEMNHNHDSPTQKANLLAGTTGDDYYNPKTTGVKTNDGYSPAAHENRPPYHAVYYIMRVC